jgi:hypothetical protein
MRETWKMLAEKFNGIPTSIIFYEDLCLPYPGWRWSPRSFLQRQETTQFSPEERRRRWASNESSVQFGIPTSDGLRVCYSGFRVTANSPDDKYLWESLFRPKEASIFFQDTDCNWYSVFANRSEEALGQDPDDRVKEYREKHEGKIWETIREGNCVLILEKVIFQGDSVALISVKTNQIPVRGILVKIKSVDERVDDIIAVERIMHCLVQKFFCKRPLGD